MVHWRKIDFTLEFARITALLVAVQLGWDTNAAIYTEGAATATAQLATRVATLTGDQLTMDAAQDLIAQGAKVKAGDYLTVNAEGKIEIGAVSETRSTQTLPDTTGYKDKEAYWKQSETTALGSSFEGGNKVDLTSKDKLSLIGSRVSSDADVRLKGQSVEVLAAITESSIDVQSVGGPPRHRTVRVCPGISGLPVHQPPSPSRNPVATTAQQPSHSLLSCLRSGPILSEKALVPGSGLLCGGCNE